LLRDDIAGGSLVRGDVTGHATVASDDDLDFCAAETNRYRARLHLPPVARSAEVEAYALAAAQADHASRVAHSYTAGVHGDQAAFAENEVLRWPFDPPIRRVIAEAIAAFWSEGPGGPHYENLRSNRQVVGCGVWVEDGAVTVVQHFR
ncbi:MAG: CAP domain-containing protein, partial [Acidobacteriota bacterium]